MTIGSEPTEKELQQAARWEALSPIHTAYSALVGAVAREDVEECILALKALRAAAEADLRRRGVND
jgi:hypothetical protein